MAYDAEKSIFITVLLVWTKWSIEYFRIRRFFLEYCFFKNKSPTSDKK